VNNAALLNPHPLSSQPGRAPGPDTRPLPAPPYKDGVSAKGKQIALARYELLCQWKAICPSGGRTRATGDFLRAYNTGLTHPKIFEVLGTVTRGTLYRWEETIGGSTDWSLLVPQYHIAKKGAQRLSPIEEEVFMRLLLSPNKNRIGTATRLTKYILQKKGYNDCKANMTYRRFAEDFIEKNFDTWILMREGQKALKDKAAPYIKRDASLLDVGDALVADGHRLNFRVINPFTGRPCRATIVVYVDWKSFDAAGYEMMVEENTQCIASALRNAIIRLGKINRVAYQDNGKAFRARFFTRTSNLEECGFSGLFGRLGISPVFAMPYNARAKIVERWFKEFSNTFERLLPSYIGASIADKPAYMMRNEKFHKAIHNEYVPTIEEAVQLIEMWFDFHRSQECPHVKGKTIGEVFDQGKGPGVNIADLDDLMMETKITRIDRNGIRFLNQHYYDDNLYGLREEVMIRYSLFDLSAVRVYSAKGEWICNAGRVMPVHPLARALGAPKDVTELQAGISRQRRLERQTVQGAKELIGMGRAAELDWQRVVEVAPGITGKLERAEVSLPPIEDRIPEECILSSPPVSGGVAEGRGGIPDNQSTTPSLRDTPPYQGGEPLPDIPRLVPQTRPTFETPTERYEWHLEFGMRDEEERAWCAWFQTTDDFRMLYTYFNQEGGDISAESNM